MTFTTKTIFNSLQKDNILLIGRALDLGCGRGADAVNFAKAGFTVEAVDKDAEAVSEIKDPNITTIVSEIEGFKITKENYSLISCQYVLHFLSKESTETVIREMVDGTSPKGIIAFTLLGEKDEWRDKWSTWTKEAALDFIAKLPVKIRKTITEEGSGQTKAGVIKYWHVLNFVLIKD